MAPCTSVKRLQRHQSPINSPPIVMSHLQHALQVTSNPSHLNPAKGEAGANALCCLQLHPHKYAKQHIMYMDNYIIICSVPRGWEGRFCSVDEQGQSDMKGRGGLRTRGQIAFRYPLSIMCLTTAVEFGLSWGWKESTGGAVVLRGRLFRCKMFFSRSTLTHRQTIGCQKPGP